MSRLTLPLVVIVMLCGAIFLTAGAAPQSVAQQARPQKNARQSQGEQIQGRKAEADELRSGEEAIKEALAERTSLQFVEMPLQKVVDYLKAKHKIIVMLDKKALDDVGVNTETSVTISISKVTLRSGLKLMLRNLDLTWTITDEVLLITTPEEANNRLIAEVYDVADLASFRDQKDEVWEDYDTLVDMITSTVQPTTWDMLGGPGSITPGTLNTARVLVVSQTSEVHEEIATLLGKIRNIITHSSENPKPPRRKVPAEGGTGGFMGSTGGGMGGMAGGGMVGGMGASGAAKTDSSGRRGAGGRDPRK